MKSSLKIRVTLTLAAALVVVIGSFLFLNSRQQNRTMVELYDESSQDVSWAVGKNIEFMMLSGANEEIQPLFEQMHERGIVSDISIINDEKIVARASDRSKLNRTSNDPLWDVLMRTKRDTTFESTINGEPVVLSYRIFENQKACQDCHDIDEVKVIGGMKMVKSRQSAATKMAANNNRVILLALLGGALMILGIIWILTRSIFTPLRDVQIKLEAAAAGDIDQDVRTDRHDEIGRLLRSIANLIAYIKGFASSARRIADGDLRVTVAPRSERDELATSFNAMTTNLTSMVRELTDHSGQLVSTATEIAASSDQLSQGAGNQSNEVSEVSSAVQEMTAAIVESSQNAGSASDLARAASDTATGGGQIISDTINGIQRMTEVARMSSESVSRLAESAEQINEVITVIDSIADQTNLLALNAAIEAARAGEQGRGFAVVADEVRKLAERTGKATGEIVDMIKAVQSETGAAVEAMESMKTETEQNRELTDKAGESLREIVGMSQRVMDVIQQIASASEQQSVTAEHIAQSIDHISSVTGETANGAAQSATAAEGLHRLAEDLQRMVGRFKTA